MPANFRGTRPKGQPRTLRTIAEDKGTTPAGRDASIDIDPQVGAPMGAPGAAAGQRYADAAEAARPAGAVKRPAGPKPYK